MSKSDTLIAGDDKMSDSELKSNIRKSSTPRLIAELTRAQDILDGDAIAQLSRADLVSYIFCLRRLSGADTTLKDIVQGFDTSKVIFFPDPDEGAKVKTPSTPQSL